MGLKLDLLGSAILMIIAANMFCLIPESHANGGISGGGGGSRICFDSPEVLRHLGNNRLTDDDVKHIVSIENYDLYQADLARGIEMVTPTLFEPNDGETFAAYVERLAKRFDNTVPFVSKALREVKARIGNAVILDENESVVQHEDVEPAFIDENCAIITTAHQYVEGEQLFIAVDTRLQKHALNSLGSQYALFLHEGLYSMYAEKNGYGSSKPTRDFISMLLSSLPMTARKLANFADKMGFIPGFYGPTDMKYATNEYCILLDEMSRLSNKSNMLVAKYDEANPTYAKKIAHISVECDSLKHQDYVTVGYVECVSGAYKRLYKKYNLYFKARSTWVMSQLMAYWDQRIEVLRKNPILSPTDLDLLDKTVRAITIETIAAIDEDTHSVYHWLDGHVNYETLDLNGPAFTD